MATVQSTLALGTPGAALDLTAAGNSRFLIISGCDADSVVDIQGSNDDVNYSLLLKVVAQQAPIDMSTFVCRYLRAFVRGGTQGDAKIGAVESDVEVGIVTVPATGAGFGAFTDLTVDAGSLRSYIVGGTDPDGVIEIQTSQDGVNPVNTYIIAGNGSLNVFGTERYVRARRTKGSTIGSLTVGCVSTVGGGGGGAPTGPAGGVLGYTGSTYPNPSGLAGVAGFIPVLGDSIFKTDDAPADTDSDDIGIETGLGGPAVAAIAGSSGAISIKTGPGGDGAAAFAGGDARDINIEAGRGGTDAGAGGGLGGSIFETAGRGADDNGGAAQPGGAIIHAAGQGGLAQNAANAAVGGQYSISGGRGGAGSGTRLAGNGGDVNIHAGDAGANGGAGGAVGGRVIVEVGQSTALVDYQADIDLRARLTRSTDGTQNIASNATQILSTGRSVIKISATAARNINVAPCIFPGVADGEQLQIINVGATFAITLNGVATVAGSDMRLVGGSRVLSANGGNVSLVWSDDIGKWIETAAAINPT